VNSGIFFAALRCLLIEAFQVSNKIRISIVLSSLFQPKKVSDTFFSILMSVVLGIAQNYQAEVAIVASAKTNGGKRGSRGRCSKEKPSRFRSGKQTGRARQD